MSTTTSPSQIVPILKGTGNGTGTATATVARTQDGLAFTLSPDDSPVLRPFAADIVIAYAFNLPDRLVYMNRKQLADSGMSETELHTLAVSNLPAHVSNLTFRDLDSGLFAVACGGVFEASLLLLDVLWDKFASQLPGMPLATIPARDLLFVTGSKNPGSMQKMARCSAVELAEPNLGISRSVLARSGGRWDRSPF